MNYLDVRNMGEVIEKRFAKYQRTVRVYTPLTSDETLAFQVAVFGQDDLQVIAFCLASCNVVVTTWSMHKPFPGDSLMVVVLGLSEVRKNGQSENH